MKNGFRIYVDRIWGYVITMCNCASSASNGCLVKSDPAASLYAQCGLSRLYHYCLCVICVHMMLSACPSTWLRKFCVRQSATSRFILTTTAACVRPSRTCHLYMHRVPEPTSGPSE